MPRDCGRLRWLIEGGLNSAHASRLGGRKCFGTGRKICPSVPFQQTSQATVSLQFQCRIFFFQVIFFEHLKDVRFPLKRQSLQRSRFLLHPGPLSQSLRSAFGAVAYFPRGSSPLRLTEPNGSVERWNETGRRAKEITALRIRVRVQLLTTFRTFNKCNEING